MLGCDTSISDFKRNAVIEFITNNVSELKMYDQESE